MKLIQSELFYCFMHTLCTFRVISISIFLKETNISTVSISYSNSKVCKPCKRLKFQNSKDFIFRILEL